MLVPLGVFDPILELVTETITVTLVELGTFWVGVPTDAVEAGGSPSRWIQGELSTVTVAVATVSVVIAGAKMALTAKGEAAKDVLRSLLTLMVVMFLGLTVIGLLVKAGDAFSECMIASSVTDGIGQKNPEDVNISDLSEPELDGWKCDVDEETRKDFGMSMLAALGMTGPGAALAPLMLIVIGGWAITASVFQLILMIVRNGMLVVLVGVLPLAAAATNTETGRAWFKRCVGWLVAFLLYKPVAALIYAAALKLLLSSALAITSAENTGQAATAMKNAITAAVMMTLAILALPALMKFMTPLVAAAAGGAGMMATMTTPGQVGHELVASSHDEAAGDSTGPLGATNTGGSPKASSMSGRQGASGARGPSGKVSGPGAKTKSGGGDGGDGGDGGNDTESQGPAAATGGTGGGSGGPESSGGPGGGSGGSGGGSGGSGGGSGGSGGSGGDVRGYGGDGGGGGDGGPQGGSQQGPPGTPVGEGPRGASGLTVGSDGDGPGGSMSVSETRGRNNRRSGRSGRFDDVSGGDDPPEGPSGSY
jgi:hypothetical protein